MQISPSSTAFNLLFVIIVLLIESTSLVSYELWFELPIYCIRVCHKFLRGFQVEEGWRVVAAVSYVVTVSSQLALGRIFEELYITESS